MGTERRRYTIKQLPPELRPRERLLAEGPEALSSAELLGIPLTLRRQDTGQLVNAQVEYLPETREAILDPEDSLLPGTTYIATVEGGANGVLDTTLNPMASDEVWSFTVSE